MTRRYAQAGFSLTEVLLAVATLTIGMVFIGGTFFVGVHFSARSFEEGVGSIVARNAVGMIRLYGVNPADPNLESGKVVDFTDVAPVNLKLGTDDFVYTYNPQFRWDAVLQRLPNTVDLYGVTVFVSRWNRDETYPPQLEAHTVEVLDNRFIDPNTGEGLYQGQWVVDGGDRNRIYRVVRSRADSSQPGDWELTPAPTGESADKSAFDMEIWSVFPNPKGLSGIQSRIVYVLKDEVRLVTE
jgi:hypothetical protein